MTSGSLNHRMTVEAPIGVLDESAAVNVAASVPMSVTALAPQFQPRESLAGGGLQTQTVYTIGCRYREDMRASYVLREECCTRRVFQILSVIPGDRRDALEMTCVTNG